MQQQQQEAIMQQALLQQQQQHMYHPGVLAAAMSQVPSLFLSFFFFDMGCGFYVCLLLLFTKLDDLSYWASLSFIHTWIQWFF